MIRRLDGRVDGRTMNNKTSWIELQFWHSSKDATGKTEWITSRLLFACRMWNLPIFLAISSKRIKFCPFMCVIFVFVAFYCFHCCCCCCWPSVFNEHARNFRKLLRKSCQKKCCCNRNTGALELHPNRRRCVCAMYMCLRWNHFEIIRVCVCIVFRHRFVRNVGKKGLWKRDCSYEYLLLFFFSVSGISIELKPRKSIFRVGKDLINGFE